MSTSRTRLLAYGGLCIALAQILSMIKLYEMPQGGTITPGSMVPILLFAILFGPKEGVGLGVLYGVFQLLLGGKFFHPASMVLDYPLAFGLLGLAGVAQKERLSSIAAGTLLGCFGRFLAHFVSGWLVFGSYAPEGVSPLVYSLTYNASYMIPETIISIVLLAILVPRLKDVIR